MASSYIRSILEDKNGNLWCSTEHGLNQFVMVEVGEASQPQNLEKSKNISVDIVRFMKNDGLKGLDFYANSACLNSKNRLWWGSGKSLTMLDMNRYNPA